MTLSVKRLVTLINKVVIKITNDITTLNGSLSQLGETLATNITAKGVSASANDGLTTLATKIMNIPTVRTGTFTTSSTRTTKTTIDIGYDGDGYPIACMVYIQNGGNNATSGGDSTWYNSTNRYDVGAYYMTKAEINTTPTYTTSGSNNYGFLTLIYKNSTTDSATLTSSYAKAAVTYNSSNAGTSTACIRFVGDATTLGTYVGNKTSSTIGLAPSTTYSYIVIYSE